MKEEIKEEIKLSGDRTGKDNSSLLQKEKGESRARIERERMKERNRKTVSE